MFGKAIYFIILVIFSNQAKAQIDLPDDERPLDVYFLADNTGSMIVEITEVQQQAGIIFNDIAARATSNVRFGVGAYKDFRDNFIFKNILSLAEENLEVPIEQDPIIKGMNQWEASGGGGNKEEAWLYAMAKIASEQYQEIGWREDAVKMLVWFGDAPSKDPALRINRVPITEEFVIDALKKAGILVIALDVKNMNKLGQAERIVEATGGKYVFVERERQQGQSPSANPSPSPSPSPSPGLDTESTDLWPRNTFWIPPLHGGSDFPHSFNVFHNFGGSEHLLSLYISKDGDSVNKPNRLSTAISNEVSVLFNQAIALP